MVLSGLRVLELNEKYKLVEGLCERESKNPEGVDLELRVGEVQKIVGPSFLGADETGGIRSSAKTELVGDIAKDGHKRITLHPGEYFLVKTIETINCPGEKVKYDANEPERYIIPDIKPRVTLQKAAVSLDCSVTGPGYSGPLVFGIANNGPEPFDFELGARMFKILWLPVEGEIGRAYSGQHQGGRFTSEGQEEKQN